MKISMTVAAAVLVSASGVALAQQDPINSAPNYGPTPAVQSHQVKHIEDGVNAAPRYSTVAPAGNSRGGVATIQDGNNPAPIVNSASTTQTPQTRRSTATRATGRVHARQRTHNASHG